MPSGGLATRRAGDERSRPATPTESSQMSATEHGFKAEVVQLLDLMVHSLYSDREIFVRELVSNSADALDRARYLELTRTDLVPTGSEVAGIRIGIDAENRRVVVEDDGIGMTEG